MAKAKVKKKTTSKAKKTIKKSVKPTAKATTKKKIKAKPVTKSKKATKASKKIVASKISKKTVEKKAAKASVKNLVTPLDDRILVQPMGVSDRTPGGLYIPEMAQTDRPPLGEVVAVGGGHRNKKGHLKPLDVKLGDQVLYDKYAGHKIEIDGQEYLFLRETEILGIKEN